MGSLRDSAGETKGFNDSYRGSITSFSKYVYCIIAVEVALICLFISATMGSAAFVVIPAFLLFATAFGVIGIFIYLVEIPAALIYWHRTKPKSVKKIKGPLLYDHETGDLVVLHSLSVVRLPIEVLEDFQHSGNLDNSVIFVFSEKANPQACEYFRDLGLKLKPHEFDSVFSKLRELTLDNEAKSKSLQPESR